MKLNKKILFFGLFIVLDCFCLALILFNENISGNSVNNLTSLKSINSDAFRDNFTFISSDVTYAIESNNITQEDLKVAQEIMINEQIEKFQYQNFLTATQSNSVNSVNKYVQVSNENKRKKEEEEKKLKNIIPPKVTGDVNSVKGVDIAEYAKQFKGNPYVWGGTDLIKGADCSGFVQTIYKNFGISIPRTASKQALVGTEINIKDIKPGDLVFYSDGGPKVTHVALYIGNNKIIHARTPKLGIGIDSVFMMRRLHIRRIVPN